MGEHTNTAVVQALCVRKGVVSVLIVRLTTLFAALIGGRVRSVC